MQHLVHAAAAAPPPQSLLPPHARLSPPPPTLLQLAPPSLNPFPSPFPQTAPQKQLHNQLHRFAAAKVGFRFELGWGGVAILLHFAATCGVSPASFPIKLKPATCLQINHSISRTNASCHSHVALAALHASPRPPSPNRHSSILNSFTPAPSPNSSALSIESAT